LKIIPLFAKFNIQLEVFTAEVALGNNLALSSLGDAGLHKIVASDGYAEREDNPCTSQRP